MCIDILKSPVAAIAKAKQRKDINRTIITLLQVAIIFALAAAIITAKAISDLTLLIGSLLSSFSVFIIFAVLLGWVVKIAAVNLGGKGTYYEGFTSITYALVPFAFGVLLISLLLYVPVIGSLLAFLVLFPTLASAFSVLYRAVKELYKTDMVVAFVTVSITITVLVLATVFLSGLIMPMV